MRRNPCRLIVVAAGLAVCLVAVGQAWARSVEEVVAAVRASTARYLDITKAREDGFVQISDMEPHHGYHFLNVNTQILSTAARFWSSELDLSKPPMLLYVEREGVWQLAGVEYALPMQPQENPFPEGRWHQHEASCHYRDYRETTGPSPGQCPPRHPESGAEFVLWHPRLAVSHVWAWYPNPNGPFAEENPYLAPYGGARRAAHGHARGLSGAEIAYSEFNHRSSGLFLVFIAGVTLWESRRRRAFPWCALSAPLWILLGVYLFVRSDPEAWPWGPKGFLEIFADAEVFQHKVLTVIPVVIGLIQGLHGSGYLRHSAWEYLFPALAVFGGVYLFFHFHDGAFHLDWIYLQHAVMGLTSLGVGVTLLLARRTTRGHAFLSLAWPILIFLLSLVLLLYSET